MAGWGQASKAEAQVPTSRAAGVSLRLNIGLDRKLASSSTSWRERQLTGTPPRPPPAGCVRNPAACVPACLRPCVRSLDAYSPRAAVQAGQLGGAAAQFSFPFQPRVCAGGFTCTKNPHLEEDVHFTEEDAEAQREGASCQGHVDRRGWRQGLNPDRS